eukprot:TRINITY_DN2951_c0_g1_i4.p1 TRINITY_DN2951_c0_g1~~TRINITY_DN2951_c0_g1_i4.p1  ORF type:complete len:355 (+),score=67.16 TRINITY_DN2951_c0_g1_i4:154-1218(+)
MKRSSTRSNRLDLLTLVLVSVLGLIVLWQFLDHRQAYQDFKTQLREYDEAKQSLLWRIADKQDEAEKFAVKLREQEQEVNKLQVQITQQNDQIKEVMEQKKVLQDKLDMFQSSQESNEGKIHGVETALDEERKSRAQAEDALNNAKDEIDNLKSQNSKLQEEIRELKEKQSSRASTKKSSNTEKNVQLNQKIGQLQEESPKKQDPLPYQQDLNIKKLGDDKKFKKEGVKTNIFGESDGVLKREDIASFFREQNGDGVAREQEWEQKRAKAADQDEEQDDQQAVIKQQNIEAARTQTDTRNGAHEQDSETGDFQDDDPTAAQNNDDQRREIGFGRRGGQLRGDSGADKDTYRNEE